MALNDPTRIPRRFARGTDDEVNAYTGPSGEMIYNLDKKTIHAQDGVTAGGTPLPSAATIPSVDVPGPFAVPNLIPRTIKDNFDDFVSLQRFRAAGDADWGVTLQRAVNNHRCIWIPPGTYTAAGPVAIGYAGTSIRGAGRRNVSFRSTSPDQDLLSLTNGVNTVAIEGMTVGSAHSGPTAGAAIASRGIAGKVFLKDLFVEDAFNGIFLSHTDISFLDNVIVQRCWSDGIKLQNYATPGNDGGGALQWNFKGVVSQQNNGHGFLVETVPGSPAITLGDWINIAAFANGGSGAAFIGKAAAPIHGIRIRSAFLGQDHNSELYLDTYGDQHNIESFYIELVGQYPTGRDGQIPIPNSGHGIEITANNKTASIRNGLVKASAQNGIRTSAYEMTEIVGVSVEDSGIAMTTGLRSGVVNAGTGHLVCTGLISRNTGAGASQEYGVAATDGAKVTLTGGYLGNNAGGPSVYNTNPESAIEVGVRGGRVVFNTGTRTGNTDANGLITVNHGLAGQPTRGIFMTLIGASPWNLSVTAKSPTTFTVAVLRTQDGVAMPNTAVTFDWEARL